MPVGSSSCGQFCGEGGDKYKNKLERAREDAVTHFYAPTAGWREENQDVALNQAPSDILAALKADLTYEKGRGGPENPNRKPVCARHNASWGKYMDEVPLLIQKMEHLDKNLLHGMGKDTIRDYFADNNKTVN